MIVTIPVYYTQQFKTKPSKTFLLSLNWYRNANFFIQNTVKQEMHELISNQLVGKAKLTPPITVTYRYFFKSGTSDLSNVCSLASKWLLDTLKSQGLIPDDNVTYVVEEVYQVAGKSKHAPRIEALISTKDNYEPIIETIS